MSKQSLEHIVNDMHQPNGMQHVFRDLEFLRQHESQKAFHRDLNHLNSTLHKQGLLPKFEVIDASPNGFAIRQKGAHPKPQDSQPHQSGAARESGEARESRESRESRGPSESRLPRSSSPVASERRSAKMPSTDRSRAAADESQLANDEASPGRDFSPKPRPGQRPAPTLAPSESDSSETTDRTRAGTDGGRVAFFGDSITKGMTASPEFKRYFGGNAENFGHNGDSTEKLMSRLKSGEDTTPGKPPEKGVILIGTNDLGSGKSDHQIAQGVLNDLAEAERLNPGTKFLVVGLLPRGQEAGNYYRQHIANINSELSAALTGNSRAKFADIGAGMLEADGNMSNRLWQKPYGYVHPTMGAGYERLLTLLKPQVDAL